MKKTYTMITQDNWDDIYDALGPAADDVLDLMDVQTIGVTFEWDEDGWAE